MTENTFKVMIEHRLTTLEEKVESIMTNHLPAIEKKVNWVIGLLVTFNLGLVTVVIGILLKQ